MTLSGSMLEFASDGLTVVRRSQFMNAPLPIASRSRVPSSLAANSTVAKRVQPLNAYADTVTTPAGTVMELNDELSLFSKE